MSYSITREYLDEIKNRCDKATPGPWISLIEDRDHDSGESFIMRGENGSEEDLYLYQATDADRDFIAHARQDIPILLEEIGRLYKLTDVR